MTVYESPPDHDQLGLLEPHEWVAPEEGRTQGPCAEPFGGGRCGMFRNHAVHRTDDRPGRRTAFIGHDILQRLIRLPEGTRVLSVHTDPTRDGIVIVTENESWTPSPDGEFLPNLIGSIEVDDAIDAPPTPVVRFRNIERIR